MFEVIILAVALSMDAFAVSIGLGSKHLKKRKILAWMCGIYFGIFQALMPLIGYVGGKGVLGWIEGYTKWVAFGLLLIIGGKMLFEAFSEGVEEEIAIITHKVMLMLAVATSIDALAAGFTLNVLEVNPFISCGIIGLTTMLFSAIGVFVGAKSGAKFESKAEIMGGVILILIGLKILLT